MVLLLHHHHSPVLFCTTKDKIRAVHPGIRRFRYSQRVDPFGHLRLPLCRSITAASATPNSAAARSRRRLRSRRRRRLLPGQTMLRRVAPSLRRAILTSSAHGRAGAQLTEPGLSPRHALLPQWRLCSSAASTNSPPPPPPPPSSPPQGTPRPAGGSTVSSLNPAEVAKFAAIAETW
jgi:hypothetical protein